MEQHHLRLIIALGACTFLPGSWDKRFIKSLGALTTDGSLSPKQIEQLERMAYNYRKQLEHHLRTDDLQKLLEPYYERRRREPTPANIKNFWVK